MRKKMKEIQERESNKKQDKEKGDDTKSMDIWGDAADDGGLAPVPRQRRMASHSASKSTLKIAGSVFLQSRTRASSRCLGNEANALELAQEREDAREGSMGN